MFARIVQFEGGEAESIRSSAAEIAGRAPTGPPEGVPAVGFTLLTDPEGGRTVAISLFATEEDMQQGHAALDAMSPPGDGLGNRVSVGFYEVAVDLRT
jgi:hypothetical protein